MYFVARAQCWRQLLREGSARQVAVPTGSAVVGCWVLRELDGGGMHKVERCCYWVGPSASSSGTGTTPNHLEGFPTLTTRNPGCPPPPSFGSVQLILKTVVGSMGTGYDQPKLERKTAIAHLTPERPRCITGSRPGSVGRRCELPGAVCRTAVASGEEISVATTSN